ncbi:Fc.00g107860.m01.CDS01 [Cosmosporella sp. VM-42]
MLASLSLLALYVVGAIAQASYGGPENSPAFTYWGCAVVDAAAFSNPIVFSDGVVVNPEVCQAKCLGKMFAALSPDGCRCGDDPSGIKSLDEKACNYPCTDYPSSGMCGGICPEHGPGVSNVFTNNIVRVSDGDPPGADPPSRPSAPPVSSGPATPLPPPQTASSALPGETSQQTSIPVPSQITTPSGDPPPHPPVSTLIPQVPSASTTSIPTIPTSWVPGDPSGSQVPSPPNATLPGGNSKEFPGPPIPTPVTVSDSPSFEIPIFITLAEALLVVAIIL